MAARVSPFVLAAVAAVLVLLISTGCRGKDDGARRDLRAARGQAGGQPSGQAVFTRYMRYDEIAAYLRALEKRNPAQVRVGSFGKSVEGRDLLYAHVTSKGRGPKQVMLVDGLMHAREWAAGSAVIYLLDQLLSPGGAALLERHDFVVVPVLNPDGYEYSMTKDEYWRKNRNMKYDKSCPGVDLNRNFDFHWRDFQSQNAGASGDTCDEQYAGPEAASEPETRAYQTFVRGLQKSNGIHTYVNLHSPEQAIYYPWGYSSEADPVPDLAQLKRTANAVNAAIQRSLGKKFAVESMAASYPATGTVTDWVRGVAGVKRSFCLELQEGKRNRYHLEAADILPTVKAVFEGFKAFASS